VNNLLHTPSIGSLRRQVPQEFTTVPSIASPGIGEEKHPFVLFRSQQSTEALLEFESHQGDAEFVEGVPSRTFDLLCSSLEENVVRDRKR
tara:strand:+ start:229 stop:498 length:270 start_codon:yes stop_codon:yes gene_type:complete